MSTPEASRLALSEMQKKVMAQQGPNFADIERRQTILDEALGNKDTSEALDKLKVEGLDTHDLSWLEIQERELPGFSGDRLRAEKLVFTMANLEEATLKGADFEASVGPRARLTGAKLDGSTWNAAILTGANMKEVVARGANFVDTVMNGVDFTGADLRGARFIGTHLVGVKGLDKAKTEGAVFRGARLIPEDSEGSFHKDLTADESAIRQAILTQMLTAPTERQEAAMERAKERGLIIGASVLRVAGIEVSGLLLPDVRAEDLQAQDFIFVETDFTGADFTGANFDSAVGTNAKLRAVRLGGATLRNALLNGRVDMIEAWAPGTDFTGADLTGIDVTGANFAGAIFDQTTLEGVIGLDKAITSGAVFRNVYRSSLIARQVPEIEADS